MASSFNVFKISGNVLTVNGTDYYLDVVSGLNSTQETSFGEIKAVDNGNGTITLTINNRIVIVNEYSEYNNVLLTSNNEIILDSNGNALQVAS